MNWIRLGMYHGWICVEVLPPGWKYNWWLLYFIYFLYLLYYISCIRSFILLFPIFSTLFYLIFPIFSSYHGYHHFITVYFSVYTYLFRGQSYLPCYVNLGSQSGLIYLFHTISWDLIDRLILLIPSSVLVGSFVNLFWAFQALGWLLIFVDSFITCCGMLYCILVLLFRTRLLVDISPFRSINHSLNIYLLS